MKIGIIADTHVPVIVKSLPPKLNEHFKGCDLIIHAGDLVEMQVLEELGKIAETKAVYGNMDGPGVRKNLPENILFEAEDKRIGVVHGSGSASKIIENVRKTFSKKPDIIIFGHSHVPLNRTLNGILFFNPGSATDKIFSPYRTIGIIEIDNGEVRAEIIKLEDK
ncbi:metallophosphoesterase [Candidatus Woesebacteria bacterium]|nr:MAG: metallophosphoesterase [Candidatus Woesebacteria bacterium]